MPGDERADSRLPMRAPHFTEKDLIAPGEAIPFKCLVNDNSIGQGSGQAQVRGAIGSLWVVVVNQGTEQWKKEVRDGRQRQEG